MIKKINEPFDDDKDDNYPINDLENILKLLDADDAPPEIKKLYAKSKKSGDFSELVDFLESVANSGLNFDEDLYNEDDDDEDDFYEVDEDDEDISFCIDDFVFDDKTTEFTVADIAKYCKKQGFDHSKKLLNSLITEELKDFTYPDFIKKYDSKKKCVVYTQPEEFFENMQFNIQLTDYEIENDILILGHRFIPFYNNMSDPIELNSRISSNGKLIRKKKLNIHFQDLIIYYSLFGMFGVINHLDSLSDDDIDYIEVVKNQENILVNISVLNMKSFYKTNNVNTGDCLIVTLNDYILRDFSIETMQSEQ